MYVSMLHFHFYSLARDFCILQNIRLNLTKTTEPYHQLLNLYNALTVIRDRLPPSVNHDFTAPSLIQVYASQDNTGMGENQLSPSLATLGCCFAFKI